MYMSRKLKLLIAACVALIVMACYVVFITSYQPDDFAATSSDGRLEFVSGENVYEDANGEIQMRLHSFSKVGETQYFSMTFFNASSYTARTTATVKVPEEYLMVDCDKYMEIAPGETKTYRFSITLTKMPSTAMSFSIGMSLRTEYIP